MIKNHKVALKAGEAQKITVILLVLNLVFIILNRAIEAFLLLQNHHFEGIIPDVLLGLVFDLPALCLAGILFFLVFLLLPSAWSGALKIVILALSFLFHLFHLQLLYFFSATLTTLDRLLFAHTFEELVFTIKTAGIDFGLVLSLFVLYSLLFWLAAWLFFKYRLFIRFRKAAAWIVPVIATGCLWMSPGYIVTHSYQSINIQKNKSLHFYEDVVKHLSQKIFYRDRVYDIIANSEKYQQYYYEHEYVSKEYPFLNKRHTCNPWGNFFIKGEEPPSIVMIIVEGLNNDFLLPDDGVMLMPFLDSLKNESLYWDHFLGTGERSFAVLPSMIGSLPHGEIGFSMLGDMPLHLSLINQLNPYGYKTGFFYGQSGYFHNKESYLYRNNIDIFVDKENFDDGFTKIYDPKSDYFWGYHDRDLFRNYFMITGDDKRCRRLDIFFTGTMHSPFAIDNEKHYNSRYDRIINGSNLPPERIAYYQNYKHYLRTLLFTDDALRYFFENFSKNRCYENTIFIITGDHPMTEVLVANPLKKYHTPLIVYSPLLTRSKTISSVAGQFDVLPALINLLERNFEIDFGKYSSIFGLPADTTREFRSRAMIPFMRGNRLVDELLYNNYFLSGGRLYDVRPGFEIIPVDKPKIKEKMQMMLKAYNKVNDDMIREARLIPDSLFFSHTHLQPLIDTTYTRTVKIKPGLEYYNLSSVPLLSLPEEKFYVYARGIIAGRKSDPMPLLVFERRNEQDSVLQWDATGLHLRQKGKSYGASVYFN